MLSASPLSTCKNKRISDSNWAREIKLLSKRLSQSTNSAGSLSGANTFVRSAKRPRDDASEDDPTGPSSASQKRRVESRATPGQARIRPSLSAGADDDCSDEHEGDDEEEELGGNGDTEDENQVAGTVSAASGLENEPDSPDNGLDGGTGLQGTVTTNGEEAAVDPSSLRTALVEETPSPEPDDVYQFLSQKPVTSMPSSSQRDKKRREISSRAAEIAAKVEPDDHELLDGASKEPFPFTTETPQKPLPSRSPVPTTRQSSHPLPINYSPERDSSVEVIEAPPTQSALKPRSKKKSRNYDVGDKQQTQERMSSRAQSSDLCAFHKSDLFWTLEDTLVIIHVENTRFRLPRSELISKSEKFRKLFTTQAPSEHMDGYPVYKRDGLADDFTQLLGVIKNFPWHRKPTFEILAPVLRAAKIHDFPHELDWATKSLMDLFPEGRDGKAEFPLAPRPFAAKAVALAEECDLDDVLKPALYDLLRQSSFSMNPKSRLNPDVSFADLGLKARHLLGLIRAREMMSLKWAEICNPSACASHDNARPSNMCTCSTMFGDGKNAEDIEVSKTRVWAQTVYSLHPKAALEALKKKRTAAIGRFKDDTHDSLFSIGLLDILLGIDLLIETDWSGLECGHCVNKRKRGWQRERGRVWDMLGSAKAFDLRVVEAIDDSDNSDEEVLMT